MRRGSSLVYYVVIVTLCVVPVSYAVAATGSVSDLSEWGVASHKVDLLKYRGGSGDIQVDQNTGWIHLGANHLEGGDIQYQIQTGSLHREDILEVWIDGYSTSNDLNIGPTVFIGTGKNRFEQITRMTGDAWRPFVFRFADDLVYGDVSDPSNRNSNWRIRYPSSKYEVRRIDKSPRDLLDSQILPVRMSMTGAEDFIIKRMEVVVYRGQQHGLCRDGLSIVKLDPYKVRRGDMVTMQLNCAFPSEGVDFYIIDTHDREHKMAPRVLNSERDKVGIYVEDYPFSKSGRYQVKLVDRSQREREYTDVEGFEYVAPRPKRVVKRPKKKKPTPVVPCPPSSPCAPTSLPPVPATFPGYIVPMLPTGPVVVPPVIPGPPMSVPPVYPPPAIAPSIDDPTSYSHGYTIQIGAYQSRTSAVAVMNRLRGNGYDAYISESVQGGKRFLRVRVGRYPNKSLARQDASRLRNSGFDTWITTSS